MPGAKWGGLPAFFACCSPLPLIVHPTDADGPPCGVPTSQGVSSLTSGNGDKRPGPSPTSRLKAALTLCVLPLPPQLCPGHVGSWLVFCAPSCAPALLGSGCDSGASCGRGYLAVTLESTSATRARTVRPKPTCPAHPSYPGCNLPSPDPTAFSQCPRCFAAALSLLRPTEWWMESTGSQACHPISRGYGEGLPPTPSLHTFLLGIMSSPGPVPCAGDTEFLGVRRT